MSWGGNPPKSVSCKVDESVTLVTGRFGVQTAALAVAEKIADIRNAIMITLQNNLLFFISSFSLTFKLSLAKRGVLLVH